MSDVEENDLLTDELFQEPPSNSHERLIDDARILAENFENGDSCVTPNRHRICRYCHREITDRRKKVWKLFF